MSIYPEINLARRILTRRKLTPPINIIRLAEQYAEVEFASIPFDVDGVSLNLKVPGKKPHIVVNDNISDSRKRFTIAHELGHVIIPWHVGSIVDKADLGIHKPNDNYWSIEVEANRFAAELLMPSKWIQSLLKDHFDPVVVQKTIVDTAAVSPVAASVKLINELSKGYVFCALNDDGIVQVSGRSPGTIANAPEWGNEVNLDEAYSYCERKYLEKIKGQVFVWWKLPETIKLHEKDDHRDWRRILDDILDDLRIFGTEKNKFKQSVNGVVAYANSVAKITGSYSEESVYSASIQRFHGRKEYNGLVVHEDFGLFLRKKVSEMFRRNP